jgi:CheY-like chemotaxis protein
MTVIVGMTDLLLLQSLEGEPKQCLQSVRTAADTLLRMLDEAVDYSRLEVGGLQLEEVEFVPAEIFDRARQMLAKGAATMALEVTIDDNVPARLRGDADRLAAMIAALARSAAKFRSASKYHLRVGSQSMAQNQVMLHLALGEQARPFEAIESRQAEAGEPVAFHRFAERGYCGSGLGLPIAAGIAELMNGRLWMANDAASAALFRVTAQFAIADRAVNPGLLAAIEQQLDSQRSAPESMNVLLVEDAAANRKFFASVLEQRGHWVRSVANGHEALEAFESQGHVHSFDLVLVDLEMPDLDGWQTAATLRRLDAFQVRPIPIVALTAHRTDGNAELRASNMFDAALTKACDLAHFYKVVESTRPDPSPAITSETRDGDERRVDRPATLKRLGGNEQLFLDLARFFLEDAPVVLAEFGTALERDDALAAERAAHSLKGLVANFGANEAIRLATELQRIAHDGDLTKAATFYPRLATEVNLLRRELEEYQASAHHMS